MFGEKIQKILVLALGLCLAGVQPLEAEATDAHIAQLQEMHAKAEKLIAVNDFEEAIQIYENIILLEPDDEVAYTNMGHANLLLGNIGEAEDNFLNALHINPDNEAAYLGLQRIQDPDAPLPSED